MYNDFVLVGPDSDPAMVKRREESVTDAFIQIADRAALFVSRGDESGTHAKRKGSLEKSRSPAGGPLVHHRGIRNGRGAANGQ